MRPINEERPFTSSDFAYEARPWLYMAAGFLALTQVRENTWMLIFGSILLTCAYFVFTWRAAHRRQSISEIRVLR